MTETERQTAAPGPAGRAAASDPGRFDLLIRGGRLLDPAQGIDARRDVGIRDGTIAALGEDLYGAPAARTIDATGLLVTPGLIDLHAHVFFRVNPNSVEATPLAARRRTCATRSTNSVRTCSSSRRAARPTRAVCAAASAPRRR